MAKAVKKIDVDEDAAFADELKPGSKLMHGQYTIDEFLNSGGFGITYLASDSLDRTIVIKECFPGTLCRRTASRVGARSRTYKAEFKLVVDQFIQEAWSLSKLQHPNIVGVHHVFEDNDTAYMALDYIEGYDLLDTIEEGLGKLSPKEIIQILRKVLGAVQFIHSNNVLHRDISPDNILIDEKTGEPMLIDFGAAREEVSKNSRVLSALRVVKDGYSPQEFYINGSMQGPSSDLYALGASFYHLISGEIPIGSQTRMAALAEETADPYVSLAEDAKFNKEYDVAFLAAIDKALKVFPKDRIQSAEEWLELISAKVSQLKASGASVAPAAKGADKDKAESSPKSKKLLRTTAVIAILAGAGFVAWQMGALEKFDLANTSADSTEQDQPGKQVDNVNLSTPESLVLPEGVELIAPWEKVDVAAEVDTDITVPSADIAEVKPVDTKASKPLVTDTEEAKDIPLKAVEAPEIGVLDVSLDTLASMSQTPDALVNTSPIRPIARPAAPVLPTIEVPVEVQQPTAHTPTPEVAPVSTETSTPVVKNAIALKAVPSVRLPFHHKKVNSTDTESVIMISKVDSSAPNWMQAGQRIVAVNNQPIKSFADIGLILRELVDLEAVKTIDVVLSVEAFPGATPIQKTVTLDTVQEMVLPTGLTFIVQTNNKNQSETIVAASNELEGGLEVGDVIVGFMGTGERVNDETTLQNILQRNAEKGIENFSLLVLRNGNQWVASFNLKTID